MVDSEDQELVAIKAVLGALTPLEPDARNNVLQYVFRRLGISSPSEPASLADGVLPPLTNPSPAIPSFTATRTPEPGTDLRSLREQRQPKTAGQMVAVLAYYLANLAPNEQRRDYIVAEDIKKFFPQANFPLPTGPHNMTLVHAKNAGYLDVLDRGQYRLNPVGHNLVTHKLPGGEGPSSGHVPRRANKQTKKTAKKKGKA